MAKPTTPLRWAENDETDSLTGAANKVEPTEEFKLSGLKRGQLLPRAFLNYQFDLTADWVTYLGYQSTVATTPALELSLENGGIQEITLTANSTLTESMESGDTLTLKVVNAGFTLTYPAGTDWGTVGAPTLATTDILKFVKIGSVLYATLEWSS